MKHRIDDQIELIPISQSYAEDIFRGFDQKVIEFLPLDSPPGRLEDTQAFVAHSIQQMEKGDDLIWVILYQNKFAGCCGIHSLPTKQPHFGLWIQTASQGNGIGGRVVRYVLDWGISHLDVEYIKYPVDKRNARSIRLIEGMGLTLADNYPLGNQKKLDVDEYRLYKS